MKILIFHLACFILIFNMACSNSSKPDPKLEEAFLIHKQSLEVEEEALKVLKRLPDSAQYKLKLDARLKAWDENLIEVPGFEHDHDHDHDHGDHHHHHEAPLELTPEDMLIVQKESLDSIQAIMEDLLIYEKKSAQ